MAQRDRELLAQFLGELEEVFMLIFARRSRFLPEYLIGDLEEAWEPILANYRTAQQALESSGEGLDRLLDERGLTGPQLQLKYNAFRRALQAFRARAFLGNPPRRLLARLLAWADVVLDSLGVLPGVDAIKEAKEVFEAGNEELRKP
jgi:hypothetical protein